MNLTILNLYSNQFTGEIPSEIGNLTRLTVLGLSSNQFPGQIPEEICDLEYNSISVEDNNLCPPYPDCLVNQEPFTDENENGIWDEGEPFEDTNENGIYEEDYVGYQDTSECVEYQLGDVNGDFEINILDIIIMVDLIINEGEYNEYGDINGDGYLNILDILILVQVILTQP